MRDGTGYSKGATEYIKALNEVCEVVCRPVKLNNAKPELEELILEFENRSSKDCDVNIQYILPSFFEYSGYFKQNIGFFASETDNFSCSNWPEKLNLMDKVFVINPTMLDSLKNSGVDRPTYNVSHPIDLAKCRKRYDPYPLPTQEDTFKFYTISETNRRKNLGALLKAFHTEFDTDEPVDLVIKGTSPMEPEELKHKMTEYCNEIKKGLKVYQNEKQYKQEVLLTSRFTENQLMELHTACDCYVCPSFGEAWAIPAMEATAIGKPVIVTEGIGTATFLTPETSWIVPSYKESCFGMVDSLPDLYISSEYWRNICVDGLRKSMREAYENRSLLAEKAANGIDHTDQYSYESVGKRMLEAING